MYVWSPHRPAPSSRGARVRLRLPLRPLSLFRLPLPRCRCYCGVALCRPEVGKSSTSVRSAFHRLRLRCCLRGPGWWTMIPRGRCLCRHGWNSYSGLPRYVRALDHGTACSGYYAWVYPACRARHGRAGYPPRAHVWGSPRRLAAFTSSRNVSRPSLEVLLPLLNASSPLARLFSPLPSTRSSCVGTDAPCAQGH